MSEEAKQRAVTAMRRVVDSREPRKHTAWGLAGDATGTLSPSGRAGRIYVRLYGHDNQLVAAINRVVNAAVNMPVEVEIIHKKGVATDYRVVGISQDIAEIMYPDDGGTGFYLPQHATTHERKQGLNDSDPVNVYKRMIVELRADPQTTPDLTLYVSAGYYLTTTIGYYAGGNSAAFSPPASSQRYDLLYLDTNATPVDLDIREGTPAAPGFAVKPQPAAGEVPIAWVRFNGGETTVEEDMIIDARVMGITMGTAGPTLAHHTTHEDGGADEITVEGLDGQLAERQDADRLYGRDVASTGPTDGYVLTWNSAASRWEPQSPSDLEGVSHVHVYNENKSGECDGSKVLFITAQEFEEETLRVLLNGQAQVLGAAYDYVENTPDQFTMAIAPEAGDKLVVEYIALTEV